MLRSNAPSRNRKKNPHLEVVIHHNVSANVSSNSTFSSKQKRPKLENDQEITYSDIQKQVSNIEDYHNDQNLAELGQTLKKQENAQDSSTDEKGNELKLNLWKIREWDELRKRRMNDKYPLSELNKENWNILERRILQANNILPSISKYDFQRLSKAMQSDNLGGFECNVCTKTYSTKGEVKQHIQVDHIELGAPKKFQCDICGSRLKSESTLSAHMREGHIGRPKTLFAYENKQMSIRPPLDDEKQFFEIYVHKWKFPNRDEIIGLSVCYTSIDIVKAATINWKACTLALKNYQNAENIRTVKGACSWTEKIEKGWIFNPQESTGTGIVTNNVPTAKRLKFWCRRYLEEISVHHETSHISLVICKDQAATIGSILDKLINDLGCGKKLEIVTLPDDAKENNDN